jgi:hypothetical protein
MKPNLPGIVLQIQFSFNRAQSRAVTGLLSGHNTLRRHLHIMGLMDSPLCRKCGAEEETSAHVVCECEAVVTLKIKCYFLDNCAVQNKRLHSGSRLNHPKQGKISHRHIYLGSFFLDPENI